MIGIYSAAHSAAVKRMIIILNILITLYVNKVSPNGWRRNDMFQPLSATLTSGFDYQHGGSY